ncbi:3-oxoacyl-[acyl-carrier protein] reductase [Paenibacillus sp. yr247]|uniref:SDR family oxidoreductase n=1 Tax=Paenibacillus sp. yr247 TaxID=1761880 RepID=UPI000881DA46|nr:SDR family oxidoreductase [Paenibacillus sp. yr247]SDO33523.1 3-oxoacyl-[acyl-carrier protein] reductase [Paenibacillus sp. yr247]
MDMGLNGKCAFVAASSKGLGKACAIELAREGTNVMLSGRNEAELQKVKQEIQEIAAGKIDYVVCDISKSENIKQAIQTTVNKFGTIDILINNAGGPPTGSIDKLTDEDWYNAFDLNLLSYVRFIREVVPYMKEQKSGRIINLASSSVKQPIPGLLLSNTFRTGIVGLAKTLSIELAPFNILVNTVSPGRVATDRIHELDAIKAKQLGVSIEQVREDSEKTIPLGRYGKVEEFGKVVAFLASSASSYITGSSMLIDGGMVKSL